MATRVFVYGTLKRGERNHRKMQGAQFAGVGMTPKGFTLVEVASATMAGRVTPVLVPGGTQAVVGEIYEVDDTLLAELDAFERLGEDYERRSLALTNGLQVEIYLHAPERPLTPLKGWRFATIDNGVVIWAEGPGGVPD